ncbi:lantibiotic dehydratase [Actinoplanes siamensis]|uniref:Lantibiotic dehydratase N-terminal domain-containing protein n=1 Tax=Actinoplanes siamensis TaxID=1223317 RepID=A0A919TJV0_9ACTN|nr:lantibiotic dehydratase [Actinoplanes siamensis]GIF05436.1 hypothetical protein Asi03nite_29740 [Actinoplanes siamensis]
MSPRWSVFELGVVRAAGFGFGLVEGLAAPALYDATVEHARITAELDAAERAYLAATRVPRPAGPEDVHHTGRCLRRLRQRQPIGPDAPMPPDLADAAFAERWNVLCARLRDSAGPLGDAYAEALASARDHLDRSLRDDVVRAALVLLTPEILDTAVRILLRRPPTGAAPNQRERKMAAFLQRLAAKCETNGVAGPIGYARLGAGTVPLPERAAHRGFLAYWAARELAGIWLDGADLGGRSRRPGSRAPTLPARSPAARYVRAVAAGRLDPRPERLRELHRRDLLWVGGFAVPAGEPDALAALGAVAAGLPDAAAGALVRRLADAAAAFAAGDATTKLDVSARVGRLLGERGVDASRRGAGALYADRVPLYQETYDPRLALCLDAPARDRLAARLAPVLDVAAAAGVQAWCAARDRFTEAWRAAFGAAARRSLTDVLSALEIQREQPVTGTPVAGELAALVADRWDGVSRTVLLPPADVSRLASPVGPAPPVLLSPDLHFDTTDPERVRRADAPIIVGELHWGLQGLTNLCSLLPNRDTLSGATRRWLGATVPELVHVATSQRFGKLCYLELLPHTLELSGPATSADRALRTDQLDVLDDGSVVVRDSGARIALLLGDPQGRLQSPLGVPSAAWPTVDLGPFTPRVVVGDVIVQRATWRLPAGALAADASPGLPRYSAAVRAMLGRGVPRRCFAGTAGERKPFYLDLASPHLVDLLLAEAKGGPVRLTEMLPGPGRLWQDAGADRRVCEVRLAVRRSTGPEPGRRG